MAQVDDFLRLWRDDTDYITAHTSGSTGTPKEIRLLKADMRSSARATNAFFGIGRESTLALPLSVDYIAGKMMVVRAEEAGCSLIELPVSNQVRLDRHADLLAVVPSQVPSLLENPATLSHIGALLVGGAPLPEALRQAVVRAGLRAYIGYGMTETCSHVALRDLADSDGLFSAMPGVRFSTDIVDLRDETHFGWLGRFDNVINSGGIKIHPEKIESDMKTLCPELPDFYIESVADDKWGAVPRIVAEESDAWPDEKILEVAAGVACAKTRPRTIRRVASLPRTPNGKLLRR